MSENPVEPDLVRSDLAEPAKAVPKGHDSGRRPIRRSHSFVLLVLYILFYTSLLRALVPVGAESIFSLMICICSVGVLYSCRVRGRKNKDKITVRHINYMIRTFWRVALYLIITGFIGLLYMLVVVDYHPVEVCVSSLFSSIGKGQIRLLPKIFELCGELIVEQNKSHFRISGLIIFVPVFLYVLFRCISSGMRLVLIGHGYTDNKLSKTLKATH
ncbi:MAG: hypothetical protein ACLFP8_05230 [Alphaproteobacteria bacterium]